MVTNRSTVAANRLRSLKPLSLSASVGVDESSAPQQGTGNIVWLLPSLRSFRFTQSFVLSSGTVRKRKAGDTAVFTFDNSTKRQLIFRVNFFYNLLVPSWQLSSKFQLPNIFSLAMATKMVAAWSAVLDAKCKFLPFIHDTWQSQVSSVLQTEFASKSYETKRYLLQK